MTPERWKYIEAIYNASLERLPAERKAFLAEACRGDEDLRSEVESLLAQGSSKAGTLDQPAWAGVYEATAVGPAVTAMAPGTQLGPYKIEGPLGEGGMGKVYRGLDTRLGRAVAIKIPAGQFSNRFEREARTIGALNHPHICTLYDVGPNYLVTELVEGETLMAWLKRGKLSIDDTLRYGQQIADALAAAHAKGITHRDLKPGNIMLSKSGVKVLDFGLAKSQQDVTLTGSRMVMGTPAYMPPEQREGKECDARADIYSLGLVLYEMATGKRAEQNQIPSLDTLPQLAQVIERCVAEDPDDRWQSARDVSAVLDLARKSHSRVAAERPRGVRLPWLIAGLGMLITLVIAGLYLRETLRDRPAAPVAALNVSLLPPHETSFRFAVNGEGGFALSPDGTMLAFVGRTEGKAQLWVRSLGASESRLLPGTEDAYSPFWSPDSRWIAFFTPQKLKKIEIANGAVTVLCDVPANTSKGSWSPRGVILWGRTGNGGPIERITEAGGSPVPVPGSANGWFPQFLPDGQRFVFILGGQQGPGPDLWLASLDPNEKSRRIGVAGRQPTWSAGHILSVLNGMLVATPFDAARGEFTGESFPLKAPLARHVFMGLIFTDFSANAQGMLVYPPQTNLLTELRWRDRSGKQLGSLGAPGEYNTPRISPDGGRVAFSRRDDDNSDIWVANLEANSFTRLTFDPAIDENPVWSADGAAVTFANAASGNANLYRKAATGAGTIERLTTDKVEEQPLDWSRDGRFLLYTQIPRSTEIMIQAASGGQPLSFLGHARGASKAQFNPGVPRWIAYDFDDSGRREIYVQAFEPGKAASSARWQISNGGGMMPRWRGDGKEIFYLSLDGKMMASRVSGDGAAFQSSTPLFLFNATPPNLRTPNWEYDVSADGNRFLMIEAMVAPEYQPLTLVSNWRSR